MTTWCVFCQVCFELVSSLIEHLKKKLATVTLSFSSVSHPRRHKTTNWPEDMWEVLSLVCSSALPKSQDLLQASYFQIPRGVYGLCFSGLKLSVWYSKLLISHYIRVITLVRLWHFSFDQRLQSWSTEQQSALPDHYHLCKMWYYTINLMHLMVCYKEPSGKSSMETSQGKSRYKLEESSCKIYMKS